MAGYPGTPLPKKLGIKAGQKLCILKAPVSFERMVASASRQEEPVRSFHITHDFRLPPDMVVLFVERLADLEHRFADIVARMHPAGGLWIAWRTRRSGDVNEQVVRRVALAAGMVDNKICSLGDSWSGMRLVLRGEHRDAVAYRLLPPPLSQKLRRAARRATAAKIARRESGAGSSLRRVRARSTK